MIVFEEVAEVAHCFREHFGFGQHNNAEMVGFVPTEAPAGDYHTIFAVEVIHGELLVIVNIELLYIEFRENVECRLVLDKSETLNLFKLAAGRLSLLIDSAARHHH